MRRLFLLLCAGLGAGCAAGDASVALKLTTDGAPLSAIASYAITVDVAGSHAKVTIPAGGATSIPPDHTLPMVFDKDHTGAAMITVEARGANDSPIASGATSVTIDPSQLVSATVVLKGGPGMQDLAMAPDLTVVDLAGADLAGDMAIGHDMAMECSVDGDCKDIAKPRCYVAPGGMGPNKCVTCLPTSDNCPMTPMLKVCVESNPGVFNCVLGCKNQDMCRMNGGNPNALCCPGMGGSMTCVDPTVSSANCGMCGKSCGNQSCCASACSDTKTDIMNCGGCGIKCANVANATPSCVNGVCVPKCTGKFADCNGTYADGCEVDTQSSLANCGMCAMACAAVANGTPTCSAGMCAIGKCTAPFNDCDGKYMNGCESDSTQDVKNCMTCNNACMNEANSTQSCLASACTLQCTGAFRDCDKMYGTGCEIDSSSDVNNCGGCAVADPKYKCATVLNGSAGCTAGMCVIKACTGTFMDCDSMYKTGCESDITVDVNNCGGCGKMCAAPANGSPTCAAKNCVAKCNAGFADCNGQYGDGCEINTTNDAANCGGCGNGFACAFGVPCVNSICTKDKVMVIGTSNSIGQVVTILQSTSTFSTVDQFTAQFATPDLPTLKGYQAVLVYADSAPFKDAATLGDNLADYFDSGGRVVVASQANTSSTPLAGRFVSASYLLLTIGPGDNNINDGFGVVAENQSPLLTGVNTQAFSSSGIRGSGAAVNGATVVASWLKHNLNNAAPLIVRGTVKGRNRADVNILPPSSYLGNTWTGDGDKILRNALVFK